MRRCAVFSGARNLPYCMRNSKSEIINPKQILIPNVQIKNVLVIGI